MAKFHALIIAGVFGACLGTTFQPGVPEIAIVAAVLMVGMALLRGKPVPAR